MVDKVGVIERIKTRFESRVAKDVEPSWADILLKIESNPDKLKSLTLMEETGGEPAFVWVNKNGNFVFCDCSKETPTGRRSLCYDEVSRLSRKSFAPKTSAIEMAKKIGAQILDEENYRRLQEEVGEFDLKTSSWILTPNSIRDLGGALFADKRYGEVFVYHNGAESYYASRGFRVLVEF